MGRRKGVDYALKVFRQRRIFKRELKSLTTLSHTNIIKLVQALKDLAIDPEVLPRKSRTETFDVLVMSLGKTTLYDLAKEKSGFSAPTTRWLFKEILSALAHCHEKRIAHLDIKLENIVIGD